MSCPYVLIATNNPDFIVSPPRKTIIPIPKGVSGPNPVVNTNGKKTSFSFIEGSNKKVSTIGIMDPTSARRNSPEYLNYYIKYENSSNKV